MIEFILGGARSGKSRLAEKKAQESGLEVIYIATATDGDEEMSERISHHRRQRPEYWQLVEEPLALGSVLREYAREDRCILVDCLTLWMTNLLCHSDEELFARERACFLEGLTTLEGKIILVSNEVGMGIVPMGELTRRFCDESGRLHQDVAALSQTVILTVAGLPHILKDHA
ncbi:bifunctional adenosylcobinamide kinase/adenosylcobinamide-phosphate guanylyltransferase [Endozoicomonas numazuensis]|uniref:Bifunctional adenosylcobalamin biosynthesis protein n=1 Tax=Endozoicomonas numazuensis TaxID=1137799 RepID=A0A081NM18_9GAMM|nr:bifunctional adenosylcobinamide kinase/adenosylcobinamide-phosphate guanylyltransferase [Endozoicomonas numazuensis]KEQ19491.1 adenosylcobinamide kinase [Endozoicomonas numazuensis]